MNKKNKTAVAKCSQGDIGRVAAVFKALGHQTRLVIADHLADGEMCVTDLTAKVGCDISTVSGHLSVLKAAGVVTSEKRGLQIFYRLKNRCVIDACRCMASGSCD